MEQAVAAGPDGVLRCAWGNSTDDYRQYHDDEWGRPVVDDTRLYEKLVLEGFQSGLSWLTILRKRENFRAAFDDFDVNRVAYFNAADVDRLLADPGIVRHRGKINAAIVNAQAVLRLQDEGSSLHHLVWQYAPSVPEPDVRSTWNGATPGSTATSTRLAKELKRRGFVFVGPTTVYSFMQAMGLVNDHFPDCHVHGQVAVLLTWVRAKMMS